MGIRDKRLMRAVDRIIREELQRGNLPSSKEFLWQLNNFLSEYDLSRPEYSFKPVRKHSTARSSDVNNTYDKVYRDLETLYEGSIDLHNGLHKNLSKFEVDKDKLEYEVASLENKLRELILLYGKSGFLSSTYDMFDDLTKVNAATTTTHVDIKKNEVTIADLKNTTVKIDPGAAATFSLLEEVGKSVKVLNVSGKPSNALTDSVNETWQELITSPTKQRIAGYFNVQFESKKKINRISLSSIGVKPTDIRVEFTPDGLNWFKLPYYEKGVTVTNEFMFDFPSIEMNQVRFLIVKNEPDNEALDKESVLKYSYLIGLKNISFYELTFAEEGVLNSMPLNIDTSKNNNFSINKVSLLTEEEIPNGTDIKYYIALPPEGTNAPEWKAISPVNRENPKHDQIIDFKNITRVAPTNMFIDKSISISEYEMTNLYTNGIKFYKIGEVADKKIVGGTERLYAGRNAWGMKYFRGEYTDHATHTPSLVDWDKPLSNIQYGFTPIQDGKPGVLLDKATHQNATSYMFTAGIFTETAKEVFSAIPASTEPIAVYVNGTLQFQGIPDSKTKINYTLRNGWNEVMILSYTRNPLAAAGLTIDMGFDPRAVGANVYSKAQPLQKVSLFDLRYNVKSNDRTKYAITDINGKTAIVLNHAMPGLEYDFYFHQVEGDVKETILFKAEFVRDRDITSISPKLKSYRLRFS